VLNTITFYLDTLVSLQFTVLVNVYRNVRQYSWLCQSQVLLVATGLIWQFILYRCFLLSHTNTQVSSLLLF